MDLYKSIVALIGYREVVQKKRARLSLNYILNWQQTGGGYIYRKEGCGSTNNSRNGRHSKLADSGNANIYML